MKDLSRVHIHSSRHRKIEFDAALKKSDLAQISSLKEHLAWALNEISEGDYSATPKHDCEFKSDPEKGHCDFCWGFWSAVAACFPEKFWSDINDD